MWPVLAGVLLLWVGLGHAQPGDTPSPAAGQSIADILKAKSQRTPAQRKLSSQLLDASRQADDAAHPPLPSADSQTRQAQSAGERETMVTVDIRADVTDAVLARIRALGGTVISSVPEYRAIRARLPLSALETLAELDAVSSIRPAEYPIMHRMPERAAVARAVVRASGGTNTQGDAAHQADVARRTYSVDGTGIGIGVISDGVGTMTAQQASGDLPAQVTVLTGQAGGPFSFACGGGQSDGVEGAAMLEIIHDLAPGGALFFATADSGAGQASMAKNIKDLCTAGAKVIVDDIGWLFAPVFQDGIIAQAVSAVVKQGCSYFSAAGNGGNLNDGTSNVWEGDFAAGLPLVLSGVNAGTVHDFGGSGVGNAITPVIGSGPIYDSYIVLNWADANDKSANDYDLFLIDANDTVLASSTDTQDGDDTPIEVIKRCADDTGARLVIAKNAGAADRYLRLNLWGRRVSLAIATAGQTFGHNASQDAVGVAAVDAGTAGGAGGSFDGSESVERFSSDGPRRIFYNADGTPITPGDFSSTGGTVLQKPDLSAADGVSTATPGFPRFYGTSAAAPHVAGIAALMLQAGGGPARVTPAKLRKAMTESALDIEAPGVDRDSGAGIVMAPAAIGTLTASGNPQTLAPGGTAGTIDLATEFSDLTGTVTYELLSRTSDPVTPSLTGSTLSLTPKAPGRVEVVVRATSGQVKVLRTIPVTVQVGSTDYDTDDDGLIEIATLAQLNAVRYDLNADGAADSLTDWQTYAAAFTTALWGMGCPKRQCTGYELTAPLDFDTNSSGDADAGDTYWNAGKGWQPIGGGVSGGSVIAFTGTFDGAGHTVANLFINRARDPRMGLFGAASGALRNVGLVDVTVNGGDWVGSLVGLHEESARIERCHASGAVTGDTHVGGLAGQTSARMGDNYATVRVLGTGNNVGGLVGWQAASYIDNSYATGAVSGQARVGGLVGWTSGWVADSYATGTVSGSWEVGGLVGRTEYHNFTSDDSAVRFSYATGAVSGTAQVGGLIGSIARNRYNRFPPIGSSYWDLETSGIRVGVGSPSQTAGVEGRSTLSLQSPTSATGIYQGWWRILNVPPLGTITIDPWDFGTAAQYPALEIVVYGQARVPWNEVGYQLRAGPSLTVTTDQTGATLTWTEPDVTHWSPAPAVAYTIYRTAPPATARTQIASTLGTSYADTTVSAGTAYRYQVVAVVNGGEATRSRWVGVTVGQPNRPPVFREGSQTTRSVVEQTGPGQNIGRAVTATDPDTDLLLYTLGGPDAASFDINAATGQLLTQAALNHNRQNRYEVSVTVSDGKDTATITVIITVTQRGGGTGTGGTGTGAVAAAVVAVAVVAVAAVVVVAAAVVVVAVVPRPTSTATPRRTPRL